MINDIDNDDDNDEEQVLSAARHVNEEAREVLASLRTGPPQVSRGPLAQQLQQLRLDLKHGWVRHGLAAPREPVSQPFLNVIVDPRAAGPHTLVALRALFRLFHRKSLVPLTTNTATVDKNKYNSPSWSLFQVALDPLVRGLLACKFEQTNVGADEAVEMAIADLISLLVSLDCAAAENDKLAETTILPNTLMDAFNTVFVTRNTFVHSPALCYHFEEVLTHIITNVFKAASALSIHTTDSHPILVSSHRLLDFLVNQLLHTPLDSGGGANNHKRTTVYTGNQLLIKGKGLAEAQAMHDESCSLCLRLVKVSLRVGLTPTHRNTNGKTTTPSRLYHHDNILQIIQDQLCLCLLTLGQRIWTGSSSAISSQLLTDVCTTISLLWNNRTLRSRLTSQFEAIFTGFYQRSLAILRKLPIPDDNDAFYANQNLDILMEIILESLVDMLALDQSLSLRSQDTHTVLLGTLETLFLQYDCDIHRSDVASGLFIELSRCCGGTLNEEGEYLVPETLLSPLYTPGNIMVSGTPPLDRFGDHLTLDLNIRPVPAPLQELCVQALLGSLNGLFHTRTMDEDTNDNSTPTSYHENTTNSGVLQLLSTSDFSTTDPAHAPLIHRQDQHPLRLAKKQKQIMRHAAQLFNKKSSSGIQYLIDEKMVSSPVTPASVASFLRNAIILGLDKRAVGEYLGEIGKAPMTNNNGTVPLIYEWDRFHKETLQAYCASFHFQGLTLLDSLRMFLAAFRLPGEAQQIDRILQAFADLCSQKCEESIHGLLKIFPEEDKKASDTAYLLSFSIIMLNTDLHNPNVRRDRKMTLDAFVMNNMEYGRDITGGKQLPREYLARIYESIRDDQIRTEGEGADGIMTFDRWKDVLRARESHVLSRVQVKEGLLSNQLLDKQGLKQNVTDDFYLTTSFHEINTITSSESPSQQSYSHILQEKPYALKEIILEMFLTPLISTVAGIWGLPYESRSSGNSSLMPVRDISILAPQAARWGIDLCCAVLDGARMMSRLDIFRMFFLQIALFTGLLDNGHDNETQEDITMSLLGSIERQGAIVCLMKNSFEYRDILGRDEWKCLLGVLFELRDRGLFSTKGIVESDPDLLQSNARKEWYAQLLKEHRAYGMGEMQAHERTSGGFFTSFFGSAKKGYSVGLNFGTPLKTLSGHSLDKYAQVGGADILIWEESYLGTDEAGDDPLEAASAVDRYSIGFAFESQIMAETVIFSSSGVPLTFTGLETYDDRTIASIASRKRVRQRMDLAFHFPHFLSETRFMDVNSVISFVQALVQIIKEGSLAVDSVSGKVQEPQSANHAKLSMIPPPVISPASEALAEVILCEVALKNKDRLVFIWEKVLRRHYRDRLKRAVKLLGDSSGFNLVCVRPGLEKSVTGLLRLCGHGLGRGELADDLIETLGILFGDHGHFSTFSSTLALDKQLGEGCWRICNQLDSLRHLGSRGWESLLSLIEYCASHGEKAPLRLGSTDNRGLSDDDPSLKSFSSVSLLLHSAELKDVLPFRLVHSIRALTLGGERQNYPELTFAALDLLLIMNARMKEALSVIVGLDFGQCKTWTDSWLSMIHVTSDAAESKYPSIRKKAMGMLTSFMVEPSCHFIPSHDILSILTSLCVPIGGQRITDIVRSSSTKRADEEFEDLQLSSRLVFEPFLHHIPKIVMTEPRQSILTLWVMILAVVGQLVGKEVISSGQSHPLLKRAQELAEEYLKRSMTAMTSLGLLQTKKQLDKLPDDKQLSVSVTSVYDYDCGINEMTWTAIENIPYFRGIRFD